MEFKLTGASKDKVENEVKVLAPARNWTLVSTLEGQILFHSEILFPQQCPNMELGWSIWVNLIFSNLDYTYLQSHLYISRAVSYLYDKIEYVSVAYLKFIIKFPRKNLHFFHLHFIQLFSANTTIFKKYKICPWKRKKIVLKRCSWLAQMLFFQYCQLVQNQHKS